MEGFPLKIETSNPVSKVARRPGIPSPNYTSFIFNFVFNISIYKITQVSCNVNWKNKNIVGRCRGDIYHSKEEKTDQPENKYDKSKRRDQRS